MRNQKCKQDVGQAQYDYIKTYPEISKFIPVFLFRSELIFILFIFTMS